MCFNYDAITLHLREDEEEGAGADQQTGGRAHRDEGARLERIGAAGRHPVLSAPVTMPSPSGRRGCGERRCCVHPTEGPHQRQDWTRNSSSSSSSDHSCIPSRPSVPTRSSAQMPPPVYPKGGALSLFTHQRRHINLLLAAAAAAAGVV